MFTIENFYNSESTKRFALPTKIVAGTDSLDILQEIIGQQRAKSPIVVVDTFFAKHPLVNKVVQQKDMQFIEVSSEPTSAFVDKTLDSISQEPDLIIAIGGGSTIDTAKAILAHYLFGDYHTVGYGDKRFVGRKNTKKIPFIAVPTTAGTGSDVSRYYLISDTTTKRKTVSRSWDLCPDYSILAPEFLRNAPAKILVHGAFDAFIHLWETYICRHEQSSWTDSLAKHYVPQIVRIMKKIKEDQKLDTQDLSDLQYAATAGGISLSNVRTGLIHDLGEALSAQVNLPHPETLFVFFEEVMTFYNKPADSRVQKLLSYIQLEEQTVVDMQDIIHLWKNLFAQTHSIDSIKKVLANTQLDMSALVNIVLSDEVLVSKESPKKLTKTKIETIYSKSIDQFI